MARRQFSQPPTSSRLRELRSEWRERDGVFAVGSQRTRNGLHTRPREHPASGVELCASRRAHAGTPEPVQGSRQWCRDTVSTPELGLSLDQPSSAHSRVWTRTGRGHAQACVVLHSIIHQIWKGHARGARAGEWRCVWTAVSVARSDVGALVLSIFIHTFRVSSSRHGEWGWWCGGDDERLCQHKPREALPSRKDVRPFRLGNRTKACV